MNFEITRTRTALLLYARDIAKLLTLYTHIRVDRAYSGGGPWTPITGESAKQASLTARVDDPYLISGKYLELELPDASLFSYIFTSPDPVTAAEAAAELNAASTLLDCTTDGNKLVLKTRDSGTETALRVAGGDSCPYLGFALNDTAFGIDEDIPLVPDQVLYQFIDKNGNPDWAYRYRFISSTSPQESEPIITVPSQELSLDLDALAVGRAHAVDLDGRAAFGAIAYICNRYTPPSISGKLIIGGQAKTIDRNGDVWFPLIKGATIEFWIAGTQIHRVITVPNVAEFDILDPSLMRDDLWGIVVPPYNALPRVTP